jgi:two-component system, cell cycle sensor histidine kinase and response regulator CckA
MECTDSRRNPGAMVGLSPGSHRATSVLVMDDEACIRTLAASMLSHLGYTPMTCVNGEEAIDRYQTAMRSGNPCLCVLMDLTVPCGMGGKDAARRILSIDPAATLIVSSGYSDDCVMANHAAFGFRALLPKPYQLSDLAGVLLALFPETQVLSGTEKTRDLARA